MKKIKVKEQYTANIETVSLGIFLNSRGCACALSGIELQKTQIPSNNQYTRYEYARRFWSLAFYYNKEISFVETYNNVVYAKNSFNLTHVNTNNLEVVDLVTNLYQDIEVIDINHDNVVTYIRGLFNAKRLEFSEDIENLKSQLEVIDEFGENHLLYALYLSVKHSLEYVLTSKHFSTFPTKDERVMYEDMPLDELLVIAYQVPNAHLNTLARAVFCERQQEQQRLDSLPFSS